MNGDRRRILVLGSSGYLGREVARRLMGRHDVFSTHRSDPHFEESLRFDIYRDEPGALGEHDVDLVVCVARVFDPRADSGPDAPAREHTFLRLLARFAETRFLFMSTDAVFSGREGRYRETAPRQPGTPYGRRMRLFEDHVTANVRNRCVVRASYLYGYSAGRLDKRLSDSMLKLGRGERIEFFADMYKSPLEAGQTADAVCRLALSEHVGTVHVGGPRLSVYEFQRQALAALGADTANVHAVAMPSDSPFPRDTSLNTDLMARLTGVVPRSVTQSLAPVL